MSILIKNIELPMPPDELQLIIHPNGQVIICHRTQWDETEAVQLPPHGRLIDASEKIKVQTYNAQYEEFSLEEMTIDELLSTGWVEACAPTIVEAEDRKL